jgi:serine/threonine protein kinase
VVDSEESRCPDRRTLETLAVGSLEDTERPAIEEHVLGCSTCRERLAAVIGDSPTSRAEAEPRQDPPDLPQTDEVLAGKYKVYGVVGRGGMGVILGARHVELGHLVAIKVLRHNGPLSAARFLREARTTVQLTSPHVVRVFDYGRLTHGSPFLVMEYLQGEDLAKLVARGPLPIQTAIRYMIEVCEALAEAHALGVVHRDLKPNNLFVTRDTHGETRIKVLDFGISKWLEMPAGTASDLTESNAVMGSPLYMSPEQVRASRDVDLRTDIWSAGVVLYELLIGRSPFAAASAPAVSVQVAASPPAPLCAQRHEVSAALEAIVMRCLQKDPAARYQSVQELAAALRQLRTVPARTGLVRGAVVAALLVALGIGALTLWRQQAPEQKPQKAAAPVPTHESSAQAITHAEPPAPAPEPAPERPAKPAAAKPKSALDIGEVLPP